ncbi:DUF1450 domain-containing protein [Clostridium sp. UBA6640]|uniref:DUF1450 domain-containing protein n=1 Tax=Clostridium sp. UBA6640 TaxID=1946370 RepID=UPI0025C3E132|nr:DUF1450 domain-containing protein [Clostridium sp. UBA6640]
MGENKISFCAHNEGHERVMEKIKKDFPKHKATLNKCIGACDKCGGNLITRVNGKLIEADSEEELYESIKKEI